MGTTSTTAGPALRASTDRSCALLCSSPSRRCSTVQCSTVQDCRQSTAPLPTAPPQATHPAHQTATPCPTIYTSRTISSGQTETNQQTQNTKIQMLGKRKIENPTNMEWRKQKCSAAFSAETFRQGSG